MMEQVGLVDQDVIECLSFADATKWIIKDLPADLQDVLTLVVDKNGVILFAKNYSDIMGIKDKRVVGKELQQLEPGAAMLEVLKKAQAIYVEKVVRSLNSQFFKVIDLPLKQDGVIAGGLAYFAPKDKAGKIEQIAPRIEQMEPRLSIFELEKCNYVPLGSGKKMVARSKLLKDIVRLSIGASRTNYNILITGESGVGKELVAELIHLFSHRRHRRFICINCAAIPPNLLESELFGYEAGAFTGAVKKGKPGKFEIANGGTLFLDEIGDMPLNMQAKILRVLQEGEIDKVGSKKPQTVDVRIVAATNRDLEALVQKGEFREDLYYRLNTIPISIPPLRKRNEDVEALVEHLIQEVKKEIGVTIEVSDELIEVFSHHPWPGNVRELENVIKYMGVLKIGGTSNLEGLIMNKMKNIFTSTPPDTDDKNMVKIKAGSTLEELQQKVEKKAIITTLEACNFNKTKASQMLGISRQALYYKSKEYNIKL